MPRSVISEVSSDGFASGLSCQLAVGSFLTVGGWLKRCRLPPMCPRSGLGQVMMQMSSWARNSIVSSLVVMWMIRPANREPGLGSIFAVVPCRHCVSWQSVLRWTGLCSLSSMGWLVSPCFDVGWCLAVEMLVIP